MLMQAVTTTRHTAASRLITASIRYDRDVRRLAIALLLVGEAAHADPKTADRLADDAAALAKLGEFDRAAAKFREAYRADPRPDLMCNVGVVYYRARDLPRAQRYLEQCVQLGASIDKAYLATVVQALASVDAALRAGDFTPVSFLIEPNQASLTAIGGAPFDEPILGSRVVWFPYGAYTIVVHAEGFVDRSIAIEARTREPMTRPVTLVRAPDIVVQRQPPPHRDAPPPLPPSPSYTKPIIATAVAGVTAAASLVSYGLARRRASDANRASDAMLEPDYDDARRAAHAWQVVSIATLAVAAISGAAATYLWVDATRHVDIEPTAGGGATVTFGGRF